MDLGPVAAHTPSAVEGVERWAAVLVPLIERNADQYILFIKRADHLGDHAGQMAFPGGGLEPGDDDLLAAALRETHEEIGLESTRVSVVGRIDDIETVTGYGVRPFVARVPDTEYTPDDREVAEIVIVPIAALTDRDNYESERREHPTYGDIRVHYFHVDGYTVWGATGRMLVQFLELATDWRAPRAPDRIVDPDADFRT